MLPVGFFCVAASRTGKKYGTGKTGRTRIHLALALFLVLLSSSLLEQIPSCVRGSTKGKSPN